MWSEQLYTKESIVTREDLLKMLDSFLREEAPWWDRFYEDRTKPVPFFVHAPDATLADHFAQGRLKPGRAIDLGCGPGRNSVYLARQGCRVDAVDISAEGLSWARERAEEAGLNIDLKLGSLFDLELPEHAYDIVYDSGCFHHIPPHRRETYFNVLDRILKPGGHFALTCFTAGIGCTAELSDWDVYRQNSMKGGLGFTEAKLKELFRDYEVIEMKRMEAIEQPADVFGVPFLLTALFRRPL